jgi:4-hydroxythreonine-4-phosphate dehydrogenase
MNIIFSMGDCNGIGLECFAKAVEQFDKSMDDKDEFEFHIAGNVKTITEYYDLIDMPIFVDDGYLVINDRKCQIVPCKKYASIQFGKETKDAGALAAKAIETALDKTLNEEYDALVTLPVSKAALYLSGWEFPGHTEMLAKRCGVDDHMMILCSGETRVTLATVHESLSEVPKSLTKESLYKKLKAFHKSLENDFGVPEPEIAVLALNPHAGEHGSMGKEELDVIVPVIDKAEEEGIIAYGPFPADGFFAHGDYEKYNGVLAMYHDQGLIPLKMIANGAGVNFTGNLPIIRTSPDHGTAFKIAGKNEADHRSTLAAIMMAIEISENRDM